MSTEKTRSLTFYYALIQSGYWIAFGILLSFASAYFYSIGLNRNVVIGAIIAISGATSALLQPFLGSYADKPSSPTVKTITLVLCGVELAISIALVILSGKNIAVTAVIYALGILVLQLLQPLTNTLGMVAINQGIRLNMGVSRGFGSLSYAVFAFLFGLLLKNFSARILPLVYLIVFALLTVIIVIYPLKQVKGTGTGKQTVRTKSDPLAFFRKYRKFTVILVALIGIYIGHLTVNTYMLQIIQAKFAPEGAAEIQGYSAALLALIEFPMLLLFSKFVKKVRCDTLLKISAVFFTLKVFASIFCYNQYIWYAVQFLQAGGWGLFCVSIVYYVNNLMAPEDVAKGQSYVTTVNTIATVVGSLVGGSLIDGFGIDALLIFGTVICGIGAVLFFLFLEKTELNLKNM